MSPTRTAPVLALAALLGCDGYPHATPTTSPSTAPARVAVRPEPAPTAIPHPGSPKPAAAHLRYDDATRTLEVGDPPVPGGRWMLTTPAEPRGVPVGRTYQFPPTIDLDRVAVFYTANGRPSPAVSLREIVAARELR